MIVFSGSCLNGYAESNDWGNLAFDIIEKYGVSVIASTLESWYMPGWGSQNDPGNSQLEYYFTKNLFLNKKTGDSLNDARITVMEQSSADWAPYTLANVYDFNIYGDPSIDKNGNVKTDHYSNIPYTLYPNPAKKNITFAALPDNTDITIYEIGGRLIFHKALVSGDYHYDLKNSKGSNIASGVYIIIFKNSEGMTIKKFAIVR